MSTEAAIALAVLPAAVAVAGTLAATRMANVHATRERQATDHARRRDEALRAAGLLRQLLIDLTPAGIALNINGSGDARMPGLYERWAALRDELSALTEGDPDPEVRDTSRLLSTEVANTLNRLSGVLYDQTQHSGLGRDMYDAAVAHHAEAIRQLNRLGAAIRG